MLVTESLPYFFSPACAVLSAILRDEYLTSRRLELKKETIEAGNNQPPADCWYFLP